MKQIYLTLLAALISFKNASSELDRKKKILAEEHTQYVKDLIQDDIQSSEMDVVDYETEIEELILKAGEEIHKRREELNTQIRNDSTNEKETPSEEEVSISLPKEEKPLELSKSGQKKDNGKVSRFRIGDKK